MAKSFARYVNYAIKDKPYGKMGYESMKKSKLTKPFTRYVNYAIKDKPFGKMGYEWS